MLASWIARRWVWPHSRSGTSCVWSTVVQLAGSYCSGISVLLFLGVQLSFFFTLRYITYELGLFHANRTISVMNHSRTKGECCSTTKPIKPPPLLLVTMFWPSQGGTSILILLGRFMLIKMGVVGWCDGPG